MSLLITICGFSFLMPAVTALVHHYSWGYDNEPF